MVVYQYSHVAADQDLSAIDNGTIWMVDVASGARMPWTDGPNDYSPAPNPAALPTPLPYREPTSVAG